MMKLFEFAALSLFALPAVAAPGSYPICPANKCLSSLNNAQGRQNCKSYLQKTIIPCPATVFKTKTVTISKPKTATALQTELHVPTKTIVISKTSTTTITNIATVETPSEVVEYVTVTVPATVTNLPQRKRVVNQNACKPTTVSATVLPSCASACSNDKSKFSSACSCLGVSPTAVTAKQATVTSTITQTVTSGTAVTVTKIKTVTSVFTDLQTTVLPATLETTLTTTIPSLYTELSTVSVTSTTTVTAPQCSGYSIKTSTNQYLVSGGQTNIYLQASHGSVYEFRGDNLYLQGTDQFWQANPQYNPTGVQVFTARDEMLVCKKVNTGLTCQFGTEAPRGFQVCAGFGLSYLDIGDAQSNSCTPVTLTLVPNCD